MVMNIVYQFIFLLNISGELKCLQILFEKDYN